MNNLIHLIGQIPWPIVAGILAAAVASPYVSAILTTAPSWATGFLTAVQSTAGGFFGTWAAQGDGFNVKAALGASLIAFMAATRHHSKLLAGTPLESQLHAVGTGKHPAK